MAMIHVMVKMNGVLLSETNDLLLSKTNDLLAGMAFDCGRLPVDPICHAHAYKKQDHKIYEDKGTTKSKEKILKISIYDHKTLKLSINH